MPIAAEATRLAKQLKEMKKAARNDPSLAASIDQTEEKQKALNREARALISRARDIEDAVYDLKAVNPNVEEEIDDRTPAELIQVIEEKGREVAQALARLRAVYDD